MYANVRISSLKELELQIKNSIAGGKVSEARVSVACNERIVQHDGSGVNGMHIEGVVVIVVEDQADDLHCVAKAGK